jgi:DNA-directed RNA polymerase specialized sigma24 family protein
MEFEPEFHLDKEMEDEHKVKALNECIAELPPHQREAVIKFFMEELIQ